ncbi:MAG TPA: hypothetical protein VMT03_01415 [Polyangia bacterium]|nr:hypothetical protein [Polyangia bacterium]
MNGRQMITCDEFKELAPAYALIALEDDERRACAEHLASESPHRGCLQALEEAVLVGARVGASLQPVMPAARVWQKIAAEVRANRAGGAVAVSFARATSIEEARRRGIYQICGWLLAVTLLGLYLYAFPFDFRRRHATDPETALSGGSAGAQLATPPAH